MAKPWTLDATEHTYRHSKNADTVLVGKPEEKRRHWGPTCRWEDDIKMDIKHMDCITLAQDRAVSGCCEHDNEPSGYTKCGELPDYYASFKALTAVFQTIRVVWNVTLRPRRFENTCQLHSQVLRCPTPNLARLSRFMATSWRISGHSVADSHSLSLRPYFIQKCKQAAATSEFVVSDISYMADVGGLLSLLPIFVYVCVTLLVCYPVGACACVCACVLCIHVKDTCGEALISYWEFKGRHF
jgi:hypothetical protein